MELGDNRAEQEPSRILVVADHPLFRSAIRHILEEYSDLEVVGEAANGQEAVDICRRLRPELVLMDHKMPVMDGVAATGAIKREFPDTLVLVLTAVDESVGLSNSLEAGAAGYVLKDAPGARITDAVRRVLAGESPLNEELAMRLLMSLIDRGIQKQKEPVGERGRSRPDDSLTPREVEILRLVVRGQPNQQISRNLLISVSTVKRHIRHISAKLRVCDRVQAAVRAVELGLLDERSGDQGASS